MAEARFSYHVLIHVSFFRSLQTIGLTPALRFLQSLHLPPDP